MKKFLASFVAVVLAGAVGCNTSDRGGDTGQSKTSFSLKGPMISTDIYQGETKTVEVTVSRGSDFKQGVNLKAEVVGETGGINAEVAPAMLKPSDPEKVVVTVKAEEKAALGKRTIRVTGTPPESGNPTHVDFNMEVKEHKGAADKSKG
jgi:uncharacterized membrane protein